MASNYVIAGFYFIVIFFSVVQNFKPDTQQSIQEPMSEIKRNISFVNHLLQDLLQKYAQLKKIANVDNENIEQIIEKNVDKLFNEKSKLRVKAKVKLSKPNKLVATTSFQTDKSLESSESEINKKGKLKAKASSDDDDSLSPDSVDSQEMTPMTKLLNDLPTSKLTSVKDYSFEKVMLGNPKEVNDQQELEKVLVIRLENTEEPKTKRSRSSHVIPQSINEKTQTTKSISAGVMRHHESESDEEQELQSEILKVKQLREAWGKACSQVVARKCQYALKAVLKDVCKSSRKCSGEFNDDFTSNGIAACNNQFNTSVKKRGRLVDYQDSGEYGTTPDQQSTEMTGAKFIDYTREGYLDMTCLQALSKIKEPAIDRAQPTKTDAKTQEVLILRDQYEKACKKASYNKCITACDSASKQTCDKYDCVVEKTKALKQSCRRRCKESNSYSGGRDSSSSSGSSSSSSSSNTS